MGERRLSGASAPPIITFNNPLITGGVFNATVLGVNGDGACPGYVDNYYNRSLPIGYGGAAAGDRRRVESGEPMRRNGKFCQFAPGSVAKKLSGRPKSLEDVVAFDALLNAGERYPAPKCHPETRKAALEIVKSWIWNRERGFKGIMWVSGAPGVGKSALLQTTCEELAGAHDPIHASFFFSRGQGARELAASLPPTIAYQFTITSIICRWYTWYLLRNDPTILREAFHSQFRKLVIAPASARSYVQYPMIVVIDGLDECINVQDRVALLELIFEATKAMSIRFLIASRPEQEIEAFFKRPEVAQFVDHIILDEETFKTSKDIRIFLRSEFARIRQSRPELTFDLIDGQEWPGDAIIDQVTVDSDGQFIFPTLFIGYLEDELLSPQEQLETLLRPPGHVIAFSKLDRLYHQILTRNPRHTRQNDAKLAQYQVNVKNILHAVIVWPEQLTLSGVARLLGEEDHVVQNIVHGSLKTLFKFQGSGPDAKIAFCHKSLGDCLVDPHRSGEFQVPENALDLIYLRILSSPVPSHPAQTFSRDQLIAILHAVVAWPARLTEVEVSSMLGLDNNTIGRVVSYFKGFLFNEESYARRAIEIRWNSLHDFLLDPHRSGEFHLPPNALDLIYLRMLSAPHPANSTRIVTREQLIMVLHVAVAWPECVLVNEMAAILGLDSDTVTHILAPFMGSLFEKRHLERTISIRWDDFKHFLLDSSRSGEFHVPPHAQDLLYLRTLSRPPPQNHDDSSYREQLAGVLQVIVAWPKPLTINEIGLVLRLDSETIGRIVTFHMGLFFKETPDRGIVTMWSSFITFLLDPHRSGEFHVTPRALDSIYLRILSRTALSVPSPATFSQDQLIAVLQVVAAWPRDLTEEQTATVSGLDIYTVGRVIAPFLGLLSKKDWGTVLETGQTSFKDFLADPHRSGEFHVPPNTLYHLYFRVVSRPPLFDPDQPFSRDQLVGVLHVVVAWPGILTEDQIALLSGLESNTVRRVTIPLTSLLFVKNHNGGIEILPALFKDFLMDPQLSREYHVPPNTLDILYLRALSHLPPANPARTFSIEQLVKILSVAVSWPGYLTNDEISSLSGVGSDTVSRVVAHFTPLLFTKRVRTKVFQLIFDSFKEFLLDPRRSREFCVSQQETPELVIGI